MGYWRSLGSDKLFVVSCLALAVLNLSDLYLTIYALDHCGAREVNPVMLALMHRWPDGWPLSKWGLSIFATLLCLVNPHPSLSRSEVVVRRFITVVAGLYGVLVVYSISMILSPLACK